MIRFAYMPTGTFEKMPVSKICEILCRIGYDGVEWTQYFADPYTHNEKELKELVTIPRGYGLEVSEIVVQKNLVGIKEEQIRKNIEDIKRCIRAYSSAGIEVINLFTGPVPWIKPRPEIGEDISEGAAWDMVFRAFDEIIPLAESCKVNIALENVWLMLCHDFFTARFLIDHYQSDYFGVNYDPSHDILAGHSDIGWIIRQWGKHNIKHIHLKDAAGIAAENKFIFPMLGEGQVNWKDFYTSLKMIGYDGFCSVEFESYSYVENIWNGDWIKAAENSMYNIRKLFCENEMQIEMAEKGKMLYG